MLQKAGHVAKKVPWAQQGNDVDRAVYRLVNELKKRKSRKTKPNLSSKEECYLSRKFKNAAHGRSSAYKFMKALATKANLENPDTAISVADMKEWERAAIKHLNVNRDTNDLGRGRIYIQNVAEYEAITRLARCRSKNHNPINISGVSIIDGSCEDYLKNPRKSGFAGFINFDIDIKVGKSQQVGKFEVQIMPADYEKTDAISHKLFDMIRILQETPDSYKTDADRKVEDALVLANQALFIEAGQRSGFISIREGDLPKITSKKLELVNSILDSIGTEIQDIGGRNFAWKIDTVDATTQAKTSLVNVHFGQQAQARKLQRPRTNNSTVA